MISLPVIHFNMMEFIVRQLFETLLYTYNDIVTIHNFRQTNTYINNEFHKSGVSKHIQVLKEIHKSILDASKSFLTTLHSHSIRIRYLGEEMELNSKATIRALQLNQLFVICLHIYPTQHKTEITETDLQDLIYTLTPALKHVHSKIDQMLIKVHKENSDKFKLTFGSWRMMYDLKAFIDEVQKKGIIPKVHRLEYA